MEQLVTESSSASALLIEAFYGGSHKQLINSLERLLRRAGHDVCVVTLPATKWQWRARTGALAVAALVPTAAAAATTTDDDDDLEGRVGRFRVLFTSAVFSLPELLALRPDLAAIPRKFVYFHENQLAYPLRQVGNANRPDYQFAYNQILTAMVADRVFFNSAFNMRSFYDKVPGFLSSGLPTPPSPRIPDPRRLVADILVPKSAILPFLVDPPPIFSALGFPTEVVVRSQSAKIRARGGRPLKILWNHRWDYDKNPVEFFRAIFDLAGIQKDEDFFERGAETLRPSRCSASPLAPPLAPPLPPPPKETPQLAFRVSVLGAATQDTPLIFASAEAPLRSVGCVSAWGYMESRERYWQELADCDIVVSTADHEFFGVSVVEAVSVGCMPLLPNRLAYPELIRQTPSKKSPHDSCLYSTLPQLKKALKRWIVAPRLLRDRCADSLLAAYGLGPSSAVGPWIASDYFSRETVEQQYLDLFKE